MSIAHGAVDVGVSQQFLHRHDIHAVPREP
jgi:hypothetical protein